MSLYFDFVVNCDLREDAPEEAINTLRSLTSRDCVLTEKPHLPCEYHDNIWDSFYDAHFLAPDVEHEIISSFQRIWRTSIPAENDRKVYRYSL